MWMETRRGSCIYEKWQGVHEKDNPSKFLLLQLLREWTHIQGELLFLQICPAARCGDFTLGDYWGVEKYHSDIDARYGVSLLLVNTNKGRSLLKALSRDLDLTRSDFKKAAANNAQLIKPVAKSSKRDGIFEAWRVGGAYLVASHYRVSLDERVQSAIKGILPYSVKKKVKGNIEQMTIQSLS